MLHRHVQDRDWRFSCCIDMYRTESGGSVVLHIHNWRFCCCTDRAETGGSVFGAHTYKTETEGSVFVAQTHTRQRPGGSVVICCTCIQDRDRIFCYCCTDIYKTETGSSVIAAQTYTRQRPDVLLLPHRHIQEQKFCACYTVRHVQHRNRRLTVRHIQDRDWRFCCCYTDISKTDSRNKPNKRQVNG